MKIIDSKLMPVPVLRNPSETKSVFIDTAHEMGPLCEALADADMVAVDTETHDAITLDDGTWAAVRVISIATRHQTPDGPSYRKFVLDVLDVDVLTIASAMGLIKKAYAWNANFDSRVMGYLGAPIDTWHDVMLDEQICWTGVDGRNWYLSLAVAAKRYLGYDMVGKGSTQTSFDGSSPLTKEQIEYAADDALLTLFLAEVMSERLESFGLTRVSEIEQGARPFIAMMMEHGFPFKAEDWKQVLVAKKTVTLESLSQVSKLTGGSPDPDAVAEEMIATVKSIEHARSASVLEILVSDAPTFERIARAVLTAEDGATKSDELAKNLNDIAVKLSPSWNLNSEFDLRVALNNYDESFVLARFGRLMDGADGVDKAMMTELAALGSQLASAVLRYREAYKYLSTYGGEFLKYVRGGRIRSRYKQLLTSTGRLSSFDPNGQNLVGPTKEFISPEAGRVLTGADYSQAELRVLATLAGEKSMLEAFHQGVDLHEMTARRILGIDVAELKKTDPKEAKAVRTKCKRLNFGIPYGLGDAALARQLTNEGVPTTTQEARELLRGYDKQYPAVASWLKECESFINNLKNNPGPIDWELSFKLLRLWQAAEPKRKEFKRKQKRLPNSQELAEAVKPRPNQLGLFDTDESYDKEIVELATDLEWAFTYDAPVVLRPGGEPLAWEIRTVTGRRRLFTVAMDNGFKRSENESGSSASSSNRFDGILNSAVLTVALTDKTQAASIRDEWAAANKVALPSGTNRVKRLPGEADSAFRDRVRKNRIEERVRTMKAFENKKRPLRLAFIEHISEQMGSEATSRLLTQALSDQIAKTGNQLRNYRIQAGVADIVGIAMGRLYEMCKTYPSLVWVQSVHDSIVGETDAELGVEVATLQKQIMEDSMAEVCSGVPAKVDAEVCSNLGESGIITHV